MNWLDGPANECGWEGSAKCGRVLVAAGLVVSNSFDAAVPWYLHDQLFVRSWLVKSGGGCRPQRVIGFVALDSHRLTYSGYCDRKWMVAQRVAGKPAGFRGRSWRLEVERISRGISGTETKVFLEQPNKRVLGVGCILMVITTFGLMFLALIPPWRFFDISSRYSRRWWCSEPGVDGSHRVGPSPRVYLPLPQWWCLLAA